jgi:hypothetical protein
VIILKRLGFGHFLLQNPFQNKYLQLTADALVPEHLYNVPHPPRSPDLAPSDYRIFRLIQNSKKKNPNGINPTVPVQLFCES